MDTTRYGTWEEWKELGYHVIKGEKSHKRYNNIPVFSEHQVELDSKGVPSYYLVDDEDEYDEDDIRFMYDMEFGDR